MNQSAKTENMPALKGTIAIACISTCLAVSTIYINQPIFSEISFRFQVPIEQARLSFSVVSIAYAFAFFLLGPLSDYFEARKMACIGCMLSAISLGIAAYSAEYELFLSAMLPLGISAACIPVAMFALMPRIAPRNQIGTFFGFIIMATVIGITLGRSGMGILTNQVGLTNALLILALLLFVMSMIILSLPKENVKTGKQGPMTIRMAYTNALALLKNPSLIFLFTTGFFLFFGYLGMVTFLTFYLLQPPFSYDSAAIGSVSLLGLSAVLGAPFSGRLIAKTGPRPVALGGLVVVACSIINLGFATNLGLLLSGLFLIFFGVFACQPAILVLINERVQSDRKGAVSSIYLFICLAAGSLSSILLGPIWCAYGWIGVTLFAMISIVLGIMSLVVEKYLTMKVGIDKRKLTSMLN